MSEILKITLMDYNEVLDLCASLNQKLNRLKGLLAELESNTEITKSLFQSNISESIRIFINNYRGDLEIIQEQYDKELIRAYNRAMEIKNTEDARKNGFN